MDIPSAAPVSAGLYPFDVEHKTSSSSKTADALPMLSCSQETGSTLTGLLDRKVSTISRHEKIVDSLIKSQPIDLTVDDASRLAMTEALKFSGIDTLEQAKSLNLKIIPPGPVLHTWYAKFQTGLFDGKNNPSHVKGLNYVERVSEQADRLKEWGIPVILVYLERDMPPLELNKMQTIFSSHENILVMSLEHDLISLESTAHYKSPNANQLLDDLRFSLCREFPEVLSLAQKKAESVGKTLLLHNLLALGGSSIIYSDIDNTFLRRPMFQLAAYGGRNVCPFVVEFSLQDDKIYGKYSDSSSFYKAAKMHRDKFSHEGVICRKKERFSTDTLKERAETLYEYIFSGEAISNYRHLEPSLGADVEVFHHESCGYIVMSKEALTVVNQDQYQYQYQYQYLNSCPGLKWDMAFQKNRISMINY